MFEPTREDIEACMLENCEIWHDARWRLIGRQLYDRLVFDTSAELDIILGGNGEVFIITGCKNIFKYLLKKGKQHYVVNPRSVEAINPIAKINHFEILDLYFGFAHSNHLGNAIYICHSKEIHKLIYFDEPCECENFRYDLFRLGDRIIKPFCDNNGIVTIINDLGKIVPYHIIECPGAESECEIDNEQFRLVIKIYKEAGFSHIVHYTAKTGGHTKAAPRLAELSAE